MELKKKKILEVLTNQVETMTPNVLKRLALEFVEINKCLYVCMSTLLIVNNQLISLKKNSIFND